MTAVSVPTPARPKGRVPLRTVLLVSSAGAFLAFLDATIVNVAFPSIQRSFPESSISSLSWILNAYSIVFAAFLVVSGRLADLLGRRWAFTSGVLLFTVGSAVCAMSPSVGFLVGARVVQALGAAVLVPASLALVVQASPAGRRAHAIGLWGATAALASGLGPPVGGALVEAGGWRWAFLVNIPFGVATWWAGRSLLVESRAPGRRRMPDLRGAVLSALMLGLLTLGLVKGEDWGWTSLAVLACFAGSALMLVLFVLSSRSHRSPLLDPALLRIRSFSVGNVATIVAGTGFFAYLLGNILWLQYVWGYSVLVAGLAIVPGALVAAMLAAVLGPVATQHGYRLVIVPGALVWALAYVWYATRVPVTPDFLGSWLPGQVLSGIGVGATLPVLASAALAAVPGGRFATASAVNSSARQIGAVLGIAILVIIVGNPGGGSPTAIVDGLRHGWVFSAIMFALTAVIALFLGTVRAVPATEDAAEDSGGAIVRLPAARPPATSDGGALAAAPLLSRLPDDARARLEAGAEPIDLAAGDYLFHEGDEAADLYVVKAGRLEVVAGGSVVRQLGAGAIIGELALLTGGVRSASIRARRDSHLLRVSHDVFGSAVGSDAAASSALATVLAEQLQGSGAPAPTEWTRAPQPRLVGVVALDAGAPAADVADRLAAHLSCTLRVGTPGRVGPDGLERAERDHDRVLLVAEDPQDPWWDMVVRQADHLVLVARPETTVPVGPPHGRADADLVIVGMPPPAPDRVHAWGDAVQPWQITVSDGRSLDVDLRALGARIAGRSVGVVMAGGGARAFAHLGVLHELTEAGIVVDRVAGASAGSIIAALWATGRSPQEVEDVVYAEMVRGRPFSDYTLPIVSIARGRRMERALRRHFGDLTVEELPRRLLCASTDLQSRTTYDLRRGPVVDAVLASAALPVLFPPRRAGQRLLADGGILDNLPVRLLTERDEGPVLAVNIGMGGNGRPRPAGAGPDAVPPRPVRVPALGETLMRTMFIGSGGAAENASAAGAVVVTPSTMGVGLLEFHQIDRMIESGRAAARAVLDQAGDLLR
ncbi:MAG TPA: DHA2 family efflux MFS transporter permease subunit [Candidatus Angelobacter sp.]|nr:DHA2 family efflux MFS transporter permease subunit [Candidatus Angelobacter sp.]